MVPDLGMHVSRPKSSQFYVTISNFALEFNPQLRDNIQATVPVPLQLPPESSIPRFILWIIFLADLMTWFSVVGLFTLFDSTYSFKTDNSQVRPLNNEWTWLLLVAWYTSVKISNPCHCIFFKVWLLNWRSFVTEWTKKKKNLEGKSNIKQFFKKQYASHLVHLPRQKHQIHTCTFPMHPMDAGAAVQRLLYC